MHEFFGRLSDLPINIGITGFIAQSTLSDMLLDKQVDVKVRVNQASGPKICGNYSLAKIVIRNLAEQRRIREKRKADPETYKKQRRHNEEVREMMAKKKEEKRRREKASSLKG